MFINLQTLVHNFHLRFQYIFVTVSLSGQMLCFLNLFTDVDFPGKTKFNVDLFALCRRFKVFFSMQVVRPHHNSRRVLNELYSSKGLLSPRSHMGEPGECGSVTDSCLPSLPPTLKTHAATFLCTRAAICKNLVIFKASKRLNQALPTCLQETLKTVAIFTYHR